MENEAVWLIGTYIQFAWVEKLQKKRFVSIEKFIGHAKLRTKKIKLQRNQC
jgi:hypothetical protein